MLKGVPAPQHYYRVYPPMSGGGSDRGVYTLSSQRHAIYIGDWRIEQTSIWHKHEGFAEYVVTGRVCWECHVTCPDEIWFAHKLQQLP